MSLMKSSIPLTTYRLEPSTLANVTGDAIRRFAFRSIDNTPDEKGYGFVPEDDMFADLETSILEKGRYMSFGFRIDHQKNTFGHSQKTSCGNDAGRTPEAGQDVPFQIPKEGTQRPLQVPAPFKNRTPPLYDRYRHRYVKRTRLRCQHLQIYP